MQTSNDSKTLTCENELNAHKIDHVDGHSKKYIYVLTALISFAVLSIWIMQNSVNAYFQQTYHKESPLSKLESFKLWQLGGEIGDLFYQQHDLNKAMVTQFNSTLVAGYNDYYAFTPEFRQQQIEIAKQEKLRAAQEAQAREKQALIDQFSLTKNDQVFFAGDSLMQGVAPHVQKNLQEKYDIKTVNLSKQSTGLSYPGFFDWPKTIEDTITQNKQIKILVVFLGANDPWDMPNPAGGSYLKFESPEWEAVYRARMVKIVQTAKDHGVSVMWLSPPNMKKGTLNQQMVYLNQIMRDELNKHQVFFIDTRSILGTTGDVYNEYLHQDGKAIKMRSADGIHFSTDGQKFIAQVIENHLSVIQ